MSLVRNLPFGNPFDHRELLRTDLIQGRLTDEEDDENDRCRKKARGTPIYIMNLGVTL